jgi:hypothetical protein
MRYRLIMSQVKDESHALRDVSKIVLGCNILINIEQTDNKLFMHIKFAKYKIDSLSHADHINNSMLCKQSHSQHAKLFLKLINYA